MMAIASDVSSARAPIFNTIEIEVNSRCNRRCTYCPVSMNPKPPVPAMMPREVFSRIASELGRLEYAGRISYHFYNEPLLRKDLEALVKEASDTVTRATQVLFTNGDYLTDARYASLEAAGIDIFVVTSHDRVEFPPRPHQIVQFPELLELTNRGGTLRHLPSAQAEHQQRPCFAPSEMMIVTATGEVVLCYEDADRTHIMGNVMSTQLDDIWNAPSFVRYRAHLEAGRRVEAGNICASCTNLAHVEATRSSRSEPFWRDVPASWFRPLRR